MDEKTVTYPKVVEECFARNAELKLNSKYFEREPNRDGEWIYEDSGLPWLMLDMDVPHRKMFEEAMQFKDDMIEQIYPGLNFASKSDPMERGWMTICIHGLGKHKFDRASVYGYEHEDDAPYGWTEIADRCPVTKAFLQSLPYEKIYRARFTMLEPRGYSAPHIGRKENADYSHKISFALNHPSSFYFIMENHGLIPWREGRGFLLNVDENYHCVINDSDIPRIHLITMGKPDWKRMNPLLEKSYYGMDPKLNQSNPTSRKLGL